MNMSGDQFSSAAILETVLPWLIRAGLALAIYVIGLSAAKLVTRFIARWLRKKDLDEMLIKLVSKVVYVALLGFVILAALEQLGVNTTSALAIFGAAGLAVGLAVKDSLSNFAAGVMLVLHRPFSAGHFIETAGISGTVVEVGLFSTVVLTPDNRRVILPNGILYSDKIINFSAEPIRRIDLVFGIGYEDDLGTAQKLIREIMASDERILEKPEPTVQVFELADSSVNLAVRPWVNNEDYFPVKADMLEKVKQAFDEKGISIPFPQQDVHMHSVPQEPARE
jgi:small conductance mechanosensitive channel